MLTKGVGGRMVVVVEAAEEVWRGCVHVIGVANGFHYRGLTICLRSDATMDSLCRGNVYFGEGGHVYAYLCVWVCVCVVHEFVAVISLHIPVCVYVRGLVSSLLFFFFLSLEASTLLIHYTPSRPSPVPWSHCQFKGH